MKTGFLVLAHDRLDKVGDLVRTLSKANAPVVVHVDQRVSKAEIERFTTFIPEAVQVISTRRSEWGGFGLVLATLDGLKVLRDMTPQPRHICLLSGSCLPIRPLSELEAFLTAHEDIDFIESVSASGQGWVKGGLAAERFTLWHVVSWRRSRWLFDRLVSLQRLLRIRRRMPRGLEPHLGQQWWCLSIGTVSAVLDHPKLESWKSFFRWCWIPDEGFFQTIVRFVRPDRAPRQSIHFNSFNAQGRPLVFHDDHFELLKRSGFFFARKIDVDASQLRQRFARLALQSGTSSVFEEKPAHDVLSSGNTEFITSPIGTLGAHRLPVGTTPLRAETRKPYVAVIVENPDLVAFLREAWRGKETDCAIHGRLFRAGASSEFEVEDDVWFGNIPAFQTLRESRPAQYLSNVIGAAGARRSVFFLVEGDETRIRHQLSIDANARLILLGRRDWANRYLEDLRLPVDPLTPKKPQRSRKPRRRSRSWSWHRVVVFPLPPADPLSKPDQATLNELDGIVFGDLMDAEGWSVPK